MADTLRHEWTREAREVLRRNLAIQGYNRNIDALNEMLGTDVKPMPLEPVPTAGSRTDPHD